MADLTDEPVSLAVIIGSTREGRFGEVIARWLVSRAQQRTEFKIDLIDLKETGLPSVQQKAPVVLGDYAAPEVRAFAARISAADAFVAITPEYNHGYPASLKLAFDSVMPEWQAKPVAFVSYGGVSGGLRAVEQLRLVVNELHMVPIRETVSFHVASRRFDEGGQPHEPDQVNAAAERLFDRLLWWARALREARAKQPY